MSLRKSRNKTIDEEVLIRRFKVLIIYKDVIICRIIICGLA